DNITLDDLNSGLNKLSFGDTSSDSCNSEDNPFEPFNLEYDSFDVYRSQEEREDRINTQFYSD
ncbi:1248_t:CDS:2, partial [Ambispora leptoticha]